MRIVEYYSHLNGLEYIHFHSRSLWKELENAVKCVDAERCRTKVSREKTKSGKVLYSPIEINKEFTRALRKRGWHESRTSYWVTSDVALIRETLHREPDEQRAMIQKRGKHPLFSYNQTDFVKDKIAVEVQFGKYAFVAYDLFVKHMAFFVGDKINVGVEILPMKALQSQMSSGVGYYEGGVYDLVRQGRSTPAVPLVIVGIDA
ncbi:MAG: BglII/BstYI family type II restriction endonuclease [Phycisphaerae bacterium]